MFRRQGNGAGACRMRSTKKLHGGNAPCPRSYIAPSDAAKPSARGTSVSRRNSPVRSPSRFGGMPRTSSIRRGGSALFFVLKLPDFTVEGFDVFFIFQRNFVDFVDGTVDFRCSGRHFLHAVGNVVRHFPDALHFA